MLCTVYVACTLASGCASDGSLYSEMKKFRESEVRGRVNWLPIPGLAGAGIQCHAPATLNYDDGHSETLTYDPLIMHVDGVRDGIPVDYVCKAQEHPAATLKRGSPMRTIVNRLSQSDSAEAWKQVMSVSYSRSADCICLAYYNALTEVLPVPRIL